MKARWKTLAAVVLAVTFLGSVASAQNDIYSNARAAMSTSGYDRLSSYCSSTQYNMRYTDVMYVGDADMVGYFVTVSGNGATSIASTQIEWLLEDPSAGNVRLGTTYSGAGFEISAGWNYEDTDTSVTSTSADSYFTTSVIHAPFCRLGFRQAKADDGDVLFKIASYKRVSLPPYTTPEHVGSTDDVVAGDDVIAGDDVTATDLVSGADVTASDDLVVGDDGYVGDNLDIDGLLTVDETIEATTSVKSATLLGTTLVYSAGGVTAETNVTADGDVLTSGLRVGGYSFVDRIGHTSGTITAGATSCTLTMPWTPVLTQDVIHYTLIPNDVLNLFAGYGSSFITNEGGGTMEVRITSATFTTLIVDVEIKRLDPAYVN